MALNESIVISNISQLLIFIHTVKENLIVCKELLKVFALHRTTKGIDIRINNLIAVIDAYGGFKICACIVIDDAREKTGQRNRLVGILKDCGVHCPTFPCIIHQEALCTKLLHMSDFMITVMNIINTIKDGNTAQRHRKCIHFLKDVEDQYENVLLYSLLFFAKKNVKFFA